MGGAKIRGVTHFCLNENPMQSSPFSVEVCVALKKRQIQLYNITDDRMIHVKDISLSEPANVIVSAFTFSLVPIVTAVL